MVRQSLIRNKTGAGIIRWRLHAPTRFEGFTDSVFAFAVTLTVVSLEVPSTFHDMVNSMKGLFGFAICFILMMRIWYEQYLFFRRYGLQDTRTFVLNSLFLFIVLSYVYPLKFLFTYLTQGNDTVVDGVIVKRFTDDSQIGILMIIYGIGFFLIYYIFRMLHTHALAKKEELQLNELEVFNTRTTIMGHNSIMIITLISVSLGYLGYRHQPFLSFFSGILYSMIGPVIHYIHKKRAKEMHLLFSEEQIRQVSEESLIFEIRNDLKKS